MFSYIVTRLLSSIVVLFGVSSLVFFLIHIIPGDPVEVMLGESAQLADREALRVYLGLHEPIHTQWLKYLNAVMHLDLGTSIHYQRPIFDIIIERLPATLELTVWALSVAILIAFPLGILAGVHKDTMVDRGAMFVSLLGVSIPNFVMGPLLIMLFAVQLPLFPVSGSESTFSIVLPALTLGTALAAILSRMIRASLLEVIGEDYIRTAKAKGLTPFYVIIQHAIPNALLPVITLLGLQLGALLAGAVITEMIFSWPGIGQLTIESIQRRDYPLVQACVLLISVTYVGVNTLTDIAYAFIDPRIRLSENAKVSNE